MTASRRIRVAVIADLLSESWPSMDLIADMLMRHLPLQGEAPVEPVLVRPSFQPRLSRLTGRGQQPVTADRIVHRFWDYPRWLARHRPDADVFHIVDHSYSHLVHVLPADRVVVTCHDIDAFLPLIEPAASDSRLPHTLVRRVLTGLQRAAVVACVSDTTREALARHRLVSTARMTTIPNGTHPACTADPDPVAEPVLDAMLGSTAGSTDLLHVGSTIPRKRIEFLLEVFARLRHRLPAARLLRVGGPMTPSQRVRAAELGVAGHILELPFLDEPALAAVYRRSALVLLPSSREGFGLPLIEALACGTPVVASDIPVLREIGGAAADYCDLDDAAGWCATVERLLEERADNALAWQRRRSEAIARAARFDWRRVAGQLAARYAHLAGYTRPLSSDAVISN